MRMFKAGALIGLAVGYVMGSHAGRVRYEQIRRVARKGWHSAPAERLRAEVAQVMPAAITSAMSKVSEMRHHPNGDMTVSPAARLPA